jgi:ABC-type Fe3+-siderophore transport system permease subunit
MQNRGGIGNRGNSLSKPILLGITTAIIVGVITPLVIPHISHPSMIYHIILHFAGMTIAAFLGLVSFLAYKRVRTIRILLMTIGFIALGTAEILYFLDALDIFPVAHLPIANIELPHVILLIMLTMFGVGVLKNSSSNNNNNYSERGL